MKVTKKRVYFACCIGVIVAGLLMISINGYKLLKPEASEKKFVAQKKPFHLKTAEPLYKRAPVKGEIIGQLIIPKINADLQIYEGADEDELEKGVGHFSQSVLPGEKDNSVLSGHRDTVFRKLGQMKKNDILIVKTNAGQFKYKIKKTRIVDADDRTVIVPKPRATLTVTTCYPFNFIGDAPQRFIIEAVLIH
ncbi:class D sortase [Heyndrickxia sporothermodurans]|uniref:Class D sortase n=3 Tax=Heyndrickxia sporothermodurans TaxID=46224 RepID=A0AB37HAX8_9BACI|nr:class D sortase [Heyndrickxia sporothermodurans]MBL5771890.1 class D sortase [Heyndrickxia sporothermodurans]MBL5775495.1 class D sortase [Heyndrickxia sporothermodurans]MBL5778950.1 class D sortase [Heyndrickxia sporothermodurans]MBL5782600.1 class D sortase [Heyndrickxia sporothermodurans]